MAILDSPLIHSPTSLEVLVSLRKDIITEKISRGTHLKQEILANRYGVSRGSVSQALNKLEREGLVESEGKGRAKVIGITEKDVIDMFDIRLMLEKEAMEILQQKTYVDYSLLVQVINGMNEENNKAEKADPVRMAKLGFHLHMAMFLMTENRALFRAWETISGLMQEIININGSHVSAKETFDKHKKLCDCIMQKWPNAVQVIEEHLMAGSRDVYLEALRNIKADRINKA